MKFAPHRVPSFGLAIISLVLSGCAQPEFQRYVGPSIQQGHGGSVRKVKGMDVWEGTPPRKFQVVGIYDEEGGTRATTSTVLGYLVPAARKQGADALIMLGTGRNIGGVDVGSGVFSSRPKVKVAAIKYL
jgi:hypothetical protein